MEFVPFPKMARLYREIIVTEKIDGTNAQIMIDDAGFADGSEVAIVDHSAIWAGSRTRWLDTSSKGDNFGFAKWVVDNANELVKLGDGRHFGEWWGQGIQRGYGMNARKFSLFNVSRWQDKRPSCCDVVPVLYRGEFDEGAIKGVLNALKENGSYAAPGFKDPEGIITFHVANGVGFKTTLDNDNQPKGQGNV